MNQQLKTLFILLTFCLFLSACGEGTAPENEIETKEKLSDCKTGVPVAIFSDSLNKVTFHRFESSETETTEQLILENQIALEIRQWGCKQPHQEFLFKMVDKNDDPNFWIAKAIEMYQYLSTLDEQYLMYSLWADALVQNADKLKIGGTPTPIENMNVQMDVIKSEKYTTLKVLWK